MGRKTPHEILAHRYAMILRPYQEAAVNDAVKALEKSRRTLVVAPTGAGKTVMLSALVGARYKKGKRILLMQHRDELVSQNAAKFSKVNPYITTSIVNGTVKDWDGEAIFSMVQTISRERNLRDRPKFDMLVIDEAHHAAAQTYKKVIDAVIEDNEDIEIVGFTATPNRGDGKGLRQIFDNCAHQIEIGTLIREGYLVTPKTYVVDVGTAEALSNVRITSGGEYDMDAVSEIMNVSVVNERVFEEWRNIAGKRKTVIFCSTVEHAQNVCDVFVQNGIVAECVFGHTPKEERAQILRDLEHGDVQVVVNVMVLTEGFDAPPVSCVVLTRPCSQKGTMIQMIGRGLRTVDPELHPGVLKNDCIVLDFGTSAMTHGSLEDTVNLDGRDKSESASEAPTKTCPECGADVPTAVRNCPMCGHYFEPETGDGITDFVMTEIDLIDNSPFRWIDPFGESRVLMASGFAGFGFIAQVDDENWCAIVRDNERKKVRLISVGKKTSAIAAADDFLREIETSDSAKKVKGGWMNKAMSDKQRQKLAEQGFHISAVDFSWTKYRATCTLGYCWNKASIDQCYQAARGIVANATDVADRGAG